MHFYWFSFKITTEKTEYDVRRITINASVRFHFNIWIIAFSRVKLIVLFSYLYRLQWLNNQQQRSRIQVSVRTHIYLQTLEPIQRALYLAKLQKHQLKHGLLICFASPNGNYEMLWKTNDLSLYRNYTTNCDNIKCETNKWQWNDMAQTHVQEVQHQTLFDSASSHNL